MGTGGGVQVQIECPHCGADHSCEYKDYPAPDPVKTQNCLACGKPLKRWSGCRDYFDFSLVNDPAKARVTSSKAAEANPPEEQGKDPAATPLGSKDGTARRAARKR
jgi:hypothetical protein